MAHQTNVGGPTTPFEFSHALDLCNSSGEQRTTRLKHPTTRVVLGFGVGLGQTPVQSPRLRSDASRKRSLAHFFPPFCKCVNSKVFNQLVQVS
jgi:hypothetical protein